jgi:LuxR family maltose regulon positive regulatory protein
LGQPILKVDEKPVKFEIRKSLGLLIYLRFSGQEHSREYLSSLLWPEHDQTHALANLRRALSSLNKIIGHKFVLADREKIQISTPSNIWFDVEEFENLISKIGNLNFEIVDQSLLDIENLNTAISLYRGDFLEGFNIQGSNEFDNWQTINRENIKIKFANLLSKYARWSFSQSNWEQAIQIGLKWINVDAYNESALRLLMESYANSGLVENCLRIYENFEKTITTELGNDLESETIELINQIRSGKNTQPAEKHTESQSTTSTNINKYPILKTKLFIPRLNQSSIIRDQLIERIHEGVKSPIVLLSAPAGYGKTTLLVEWVASSDLPIGWYSLDNTDNDPNQFLAYLISTITEIHDGVGQNCLRILQNSPSVSAQSILTLFLKDLESIYENVVIILDDYHSITSQSVHELFLYLIEHQPTFLHIIIATRADPPLRLSRLRTNQQIIEIRVNDLRFNLAEIDEFLNHTLELNLASDQLSILENRTEGWIVGLQMAAFAISTKADKKNDFIRSFSGSHRLILDYLADEVINHLPAEIQDFLIKTSILDRLNGPLCNKVTDSENCQEILEALEQNNMFLISIDDERYWFRYHHLFRELLQNRLRKNQPFQINDLHLRASEWYEANEMPADAIQHALAANDFEHAADLAELVWPAWIDASKAIVWFGWVKTLPDEIIRARPVLSIAFAEANLISGKLEAAEARLVDAERWLESIPDMRMPDKVKASKKVFENYEQLRNLPISIAIARSHLAQAIGDVPGTMQYAKKALDILPEGAHSLREQATSLLGLAYWASGDTELAHRTFSDGLIGNIYAMIHGAYVVADMEFTLGHLKEALITCEHALQLAAEHGYTVSSGVAEVYICMSNLHREQGDLEAAEQDLAKSKMLGDQVELQDWKYRWCVAQSRLMQSQRFLDEALVLLDKAERLYIRTAVHEVRPIAARKARVWVAQGRLDEALGWARERGLSAEDELSFLHEFEYITLARVLIAHYELERKDDSIHDAIGLLDRLMKAAEDPGRMGSAIEILVLQALTYQAQGDTPKALVSLQHALRLAEPEGFNRIFVDEGLPMEKLLGKLEAEDENIKCYIQKLLITFSEKETRFSSVPQTLIDPLSEREIEVLQLMAEGLTNPEIASKLYLSLHTVKVHSRNIYNKLGVHNRTRAVILAREMGILPSN